MCLWDIREKRESFCYYMISLDSHYKFLNNSILRWIWTKFCYGWCSYKEEDFDDSKIFHVYTEFPFNKRKHFYDFYIFNTKQVIIVPPISWIDFIISHIKNDNVDIYLKYGLRYNKQDPVDIYKINEEKELFELSLKYDGEYNLN